MPRKTDGLYLRGPYFYFKAKDVDGVWREHATRTSSYGEARAIRFRFLVEQDKNQLPTERYTWTLQQAVERRGVERQQRIAKGSFQSEAAIMRTLQRLLGPRTLLQKLVDIEVVRRYRTDRLREGIKPKTINNEILVLAGILHDAKLWRRVQPDYKPLRVMTSDIPDALTRDEAYRLLQVARTSGQDSVAALVAVLSFGTGMRSGEIKKLQRGSIQLHSAQPQIQVKRATTKTNKGARFVALDSMACWALGKLLNRAARLGATQPDHYLLPTLLSRHTRSTDPLNGGSGWDPTHPQSSWEADWDCVRKQAHIERHRFHNMRHSFVTRAAESGVPLMVIQQQVGHMSKAMVELYCHISQAALHKAARLMEDQNPDLLSQLGLPNIVGRTQPSSTPKKSDKALEVLIRYENPKGVIQ